MYHSDFFYLSVILFCAFLAVVIVMVYEYRINEYIIRLKHYQKAVDDLQAHIKALENLVDVLDKKE